MKIPFLKNFRRGFATNSSSSHSFVYLKEAQGLGGENPGRYTDSEFGWGDFRLDTIREKLFYVLVGMVGGGWEPKSAAEDYEEYGEQFPELTEDDFEQAVHGYVDHESWGLISADQARDPYLVVFGGNDNSDGSEERHAAIRSGEVDWTRTVMEYDDLEFIRQDDEEGQKAVKRFYEANPWAAR